MRLPKDTVVDPHGYGLIIAALIRHKTMNRHLSHNNWASYHELLVGGVR